jgi:outer membrane protein assembly factor BamB
VQRLTLALMVTLASPVAADFPQFRGPAGSGVTDANPPATWSADANIAWTAKLPGSGWSQPVVVGDTVFVTAAVSDKLAKPKDMQAGVRDLQSIPGVGGRAPQADVEWRLTALDAATGAVRWSRTVAAGRPKHPVHPSNTYATETPCADAERVYAYFGATGTLAAFDHAGSERWRADLGTYKVISGFGSGGSPALFGGRLFIASFNEEQSFLAAFDAATGAEVWRKGQKAGSAWATPFVWRNSKRAEVVACGNGVVTAHDPDTGAELWRLGGIDSAFAPSPAAAGDLLVMGANSPFSKAPMAAVRAGAAGDVTLKDGATSSDAVAWFRTGGNVGLASPVAVGDCVYFPSGSYLSCYDARTGERKYKERLPLFRTVTACALAAGDRVLVLDEAGRAAWVKAGPKFEVVAAGEIKDTFWASPAASGSRLFLRGVEGLYCVTK